MQQVLQTQSFLSNQLLTWLLQSQRLNEVLEYILDEDGIHRRADYKLIHYTLTEEIFVFFIWSISLVLRTVSLCVISGSYFYTVNSQFQEHPLLVHMLLSRFFSMLEYWVTRYMNVPPNNVLVTGLIAQSCRKTFTSIDPRDLDPN